MIPWFETIGVVFVAFVGVVFGRLFSRLKKPYWTLGYFLPLLLILSLVIARYNNLFTLTLPCLWLTAGRIKFVILSLTVTMGLVTVLSRLPRRLERVLVSILITVVVIWFSILPFVVPILVKDHLSNLRTMVDSNGICFQTTAYTCAPAAAVTALRKLGLPAQEGELAVLSHTSPFTGTLPWCLYTALQNRYRADGLECQYRIFDSTAQLKDAGVILAVVKDAFLLDHCVAIIDVSDKIITVADPVMGRILMPHEQFEKIWRFSGIVLKRNTTQSI